MKTVFISYAWESEEHVGWVKKLADELEQYDDIHVKLDQYDLTPLIDKNKFMEDGVFKSDFMLVVGTKMYAQKANDREGGVGEETYLGTADFWDSMLSKGSTNIINVLREKDGTPNYLTGKFYVDFCVDDKFDDKVVELLSVINEDYTKPRPQKTKGLSTMKKKTIS